MAGLTGVILIEIYAAVMQRFFQNTDNIVGKGFTVLGIYLFAIIYCKFFRPRPNHSTQANPLLQTVCLTALHGCTARRFCLLRCAARSWALRRLLTSL